MNELAKYEDVDDADLPECPQSDRWQDPIKYAVKKKGNKKAKRLFDTLADAEDYLSVQKDDCLIETRESIPKRCVGYCSASGFCSWYQTYKQQEEDGIIISSTDTIGCELLSEAFTEYTSKQEQS
jgi:hypothetical protein